MLALRASEVRYVKSAREEYKLLNRSRILSVELTDERQLELEAGGDTPVRLVLPQTKNEDVVLRAELYDRLRALLDDIGMAQVGGLVARTMREDDDDDPTLESYQKYRR